MTRKLLFGTAGIPRSSEGKSTEDGIKQIKALGLECMEIEFVRGVYMSETQAQRVREIAKSEGIEITVHAPYFINLNSMEREKVSASKKRILDSARIGAIAGAKSVTFHPAFYSRMPANEVYRVVKAALCEIVETLKNEQIKIDISPETTGKGTQFGSLDELINLSQEIPGVKPCVDFSHIYARETGKCNSYQEFIRLIDNIETKLGTEALKNMHIHVSGMHYGPKGELNHLNVQDTGSFFRYKELMRALYDRGVCGLLISESPNLETDALLFKRVYEQS